MILAFEIICIIILSFLLILLILNERKKDKSQLRSVKIQKLWNGAERRAAKRLNVELKAKYYLNGKPTNSKTRDISTKGIGLVLDEKLSPGTSLRLQILLPEKNKLIRAKGVVVWSRDSAVKSFNKRLFDTGIKFTYLDESSEKELFTLIDSANK